MPWGKIVGKQWTLKHPRADKDKVAENLDLHLIQTKILGVEIFDETRLARLQKAAIKIIAPGVIRADYALCMSVPLQQFMATMLADVIKGPQLAIFASTGEYALSLDLGCDITAGLGKLFLMT